MQGAQVVEHSRHLEAKIRVVGHNDAILIPDDSACYSRVTIPDKSSNPLPLKIEHAIFDVESILDEMELAVVLLDQIRARRVHGWANARAGAETLQLRDLTLKVVRILSIAILWNAQCLECLFA